MVAKVKLLLVLSIAVGANVFDAPAQTPTQGQVLAEYGDAQALAVDPRGRLYVADAARDVVEVLGPRGQRKMVLGGSGTRPGEFDLPSDVDPTNGQLILVADAYNGRIQRFSEEGQYLESLPIGQLDRGGSDGWTFQDEQDGGSVQGDGRPMAVARDDEGTIFVLDAATRRLLTWSDLGRSGQISQAGGGRLQDPVALAVGNGQRVYVADAGKEAVLVYDSFGTFLRRLTLPSLPTIRALTVHRGRLYIVCAERVLVWERRDGLLAEHAVTLKEPLVDAALRGDGLYFLTPTRLLRRAGW
jgi:DNA-binding beta-propeller fold protein YncE